MGSKWLALEKPLFGEDIVYEEDKWRGEEDKPMGSAWLLLEGDYDYYSDKFGRHTTDVAIPIIPVNIGLPFACQGVAFPESYLGQVSDILGIDLGGIYKKESTDVKGVFLLKNKFAVQIDASDFENGVELIMRGVLSKYTSAIDGDIIVSCPHGINSSVVTVDGKLHIKFYSIPSHYKKSTFSLASVLDIL